MVTDTEGLVSAQIRQTDWTAQIMDRIGRADEVLATFRLPAQSYQVKLDGAMYSSQCAWRRLSVGSTLQEREGYMVSCYHTRFTCQVTPPLTKCLRTREHFLFSSVVVAFSRGELLADECDRAALLQ